jgi:hypothetical protein
MTIYTDVSFLVSWLYKPDLLNAKARVWFAQYQTGDFLISDWSRFETINTLRDLCLRPYPPKPELIEALTSMPYRNSGIDDADGVLDGSFAASVSAEPRPTTDRLAQRSLAGALATLGDGHACNPSQGTAHH